MRRLREAVLAFTFHGDEHLPKTVREYHAKYKGVSRVRDEHPELLTAVHEDLKRLSPGGRKGRRGDFTWETILRALVVHASEGLALRETVVRIAESDFLQDFLRTREGGHGPQLPGQVPAHGPRGDLEEGRQGMRSDLAGIYTCSTPGTCIRDNVVHDVSRRNYGGWGIHADQGSHDMLLQKNLVYRCQDDALFAHHNHNITAENNIFAFNRRHKSSTAVAAGSS